MPRTNWLGWGVGIVCVATIYHAVVSRLVFVEWRREDFDYCYLIPVIVAYLIWERKVELSSMPSRSSWAGLAAAFGAAVFLVLGELGGEFLALFLSLWLAVFAFCWALLGWQKLKLILFPLVFFITAFPPPNYIYSRLTLNLQLISTKFGADFLHLVGVPAFREGNVIDLGFTQLEVVAACSGLRFLIPLIIVGILLAYYLKDDWWKRGLLLALTLPLAVVMNGLRIGVTGLLTRNYGMQFAEGTVHDIFGWIMFVLSTLILLGFMHLLSARQGRHAQRKTEFALIETDRDVAGSILPVLVVAGMLGICGAFVKYRELKPDVLPQAQVLNSFPVTFDGWRGRSVALEQQFIEALHFTDYLQMDFRDDVGKTVDFYVAWYASQSKGASIHSPETCLRGGGWQFDQVGEIDVQVSGYKNIRVNRSILEQGGQRMLAYFWFPLRGYYAVNGIELKIQTFLSALLHGRTDGALVRLITPLYPGEDEKQAELRLQDFMAKALPKLDNMLPQ